MYIHIYTHMHIHTYIYIYRERERDTTYDILLCAILQYIMIEYIIVCFAVRHLVPARQLRSSDSSDPGAVLAREQAPVSGVNRGQYVRRVV